MAYEFIKVDREGPVTVFTLNRPEVMNALHSPMHFELDEAFNSFAADPDQWVGIVTGAGERAFSAGNDLKHQAGGGKMGSPASGFAGLTSRFDLNKPLIAAVNGVAMGGGFEIALACDLIIAAESAVFALPEPKVGLAALAGCAEQQQSAAPGARRYYVDTQGIAALCTVPGLTTWMLPANGSAEVGALTAFHGCESSAVSVPVKLTVWTRSRSMKP